VYGAVGIDLPIAPLDQEHGPFVPPTEKGMSYWLTHRPGYILAHSAQLEKWPFNALSAARVGDLIEVTAPAGVVQCKVSNVTSYPKHDLEVDVKTPVWDIDNHLLRLIGCKDGDVWEQVTVVTARCGN
jgi:sortase (surface protein transpeptidase)